MAHLLVSISGHGLGHLAQTGPVLSALRQRCPHLELTICSSLPHRHLARRIPGEFIHIPEADDFGFVMRDALSIDLPATADRYRQFHANWSERVLAAAAKLKVLKPDAILSNIAYLPLAAAAEARIPALALCSLNWADLFHHYFSDQFWATPIERQILAAYRAAALFLRTTPGMPMPRLKNVETIAPIARYVTPNRPHIANALGLSEYQRWGVAGLGGFDLPQPEAIWPQRPDLAWLLPAAWPGRRADIFHFDSTVDFGEILACADFFVTKPGYGSFVEASIQGVPVLYLRRPDWPEEPCLLTWLHRHNRALDLGGESDLAIQLPAALDRLPELALLPRPAAAGAEAAAQAILRHLPC